VGSFKDKVESLTVSDDKSSNLIEDSSEVELRGIAVSDKTSTNLIEDPSQVDSRALANPDESGRPPASSLHLPKLGSQHSLHHLPMTSGEP
jgi:hypothetical protein